ncbi:MAG: hypothetical protein HND50_17340 [Calditrichaeota bacterium]|nr:hypothetical protein [Calditrichota bacterium]
MKNEEEFIFPKRWGTFKPKFIFSLVGILDLLGIIICYIGIGYGRKTVLDLQGKTQMP